MFDGSAHITLLPIVPNQPATLAQRVHAGLQLHQSVRVVVGGVEVQEVEFYVGASQEVNRLHPYDFDVRVIAVDVRDLLEPLLGFLGTMPHIGHRPIPWVNEVERRTVRQQELPEAATMDAEFCTYHVTT